MARKVPRKQSFWNQGQKRPSLNARADHRVRHSHSAQPVARSVGPLTSGKHRITLIDNFAAYITLEDAFAAYGRLLIEGRFFKNRFARYRTHRNLPQLLADMKGGDGDPPYATDPTYDTKILQLSGQSNVRAALAAARSASV
jgi:hypothetical protein